MNRIRIALILMTFGAVGMFAADQTLKITRKTLAGNLYLFVEAGGFSTRHKPGWKSKLLVLTQE